MFTRERASSMKQAYQGHFQRGFRECLYIRRCVSWPFVSYSINFLSFKYSRNHRRGPCNDPESAEEGDVKVQYSAD